ncbi:cytochrome ubiquinol oxidase subunit I [Halobacillus sp. ACCC02827]|uniref:cytochrome ubiquinol oxidase subunit I n=1 Tax=Bacillaceae TaxID=186817 RepID=UPI0002A4F69F|nr:MULTISPECIES: cytochrome ubiquinol oxidase subunit I [Bacillaceae]ELK47474.1 cytochrome d ubiquinol oxidase subunit I [Halobacillus sp. BAB-2008]QHT45264.1 cytochrome ubiquinol oxidase subunit I [Bacillus sp. SB49]WJE16044.1 cytochrome ubiquinol oxidase subunit I [Halobacillus sp. ACCC02827]
MDVVVMARALFGTSLGFHIIYATIGVGLPVMIIIAEVLYFIKKDSDYALMARRWTKGFAILLAVSIASGTIVGVMISLLFPDFMEIVGQVIALPFQMEIFAFLIEAVFMSIYLYAADRLPPSLRLTSIIFVALGATASAILITDVHAWMNTPAGFRITPDGEVTDVDTWAAFFNPSFGVTAIHTTLSAYMTVAFLVASIAALRLMRKNISLKERKYHKKALMIAIYFGALTSLATAINGHETAQVLYENNPRKLAAAEGLFETTRYAPLSIGGYTSAAEERVKYAIEIPGGLSFLAGDRFDTEVMGLNEWPEELWPPLYVHILFNVMVGIGSVLIFVAMIALFWKHVLKREFPSWLLALFVVSGPLAMIAIESGWCFSCIGRQPWTITDVLRTGDAATKSSSVGFLFYLFITLYITLLFVTGFVLRYYFKKHPVTKDLEPSETT